MATSSRNVPRFLPTLTEVVRSPVAAPPAANAARDEPRLDEIAIAETVRAQVEAELGELLRDAVATAVLEHADAIASRVREEIEPVLRQSVSDMVAHEIASRRQS